MKTTDTILDKIVVSKREYLVGRKREKPQATIERELETLEEFKGSGFYDTLKAAKPQPKIIAEVKKGSPSAGVIRQEFSLEDINQAYQAAENVVAISVITEKAHFGGSEETLAFFAQNNTNKKPLLRKDFIFDPYQIIEAKLLGAQAYLLIASLFEQEELQELIEVGLSIGIEPLVEAHTQEEFDMVRQSSARCIGINARDLKTFKVDINTHKLLGQLDGSYARVAESGIDKPEDLASLSGIADAALVGSYFMKAPNISVAIEELINQKTPRKEAL